jgi:hypothetical protein
MIASLQLKEHTLPTGIPGLSHDNFLEIQFFGTFQ